MASMGRWDIRDFKGILERSGDFYTQLAQVGFWGHLSQLLLPL